MSGQPDGDLARRFLAAAVALMPASRRDWGRAMLAELDQVAGPAARWRFAVGAAWATLTVPRARRLPRLAAIVLAGAGCAAGAAGPHTDDWLLMALFSSDLTCYLCLALRPAAPLAAGRRTGLLGLAASLVMAGGLLLSRFSACPPSSPGWRHPPLCTPRPRWPRVTTAAG
jgi:hypothetical protein